MTKSRALRIVQLLEETYPNAHCELVHQNAFELLIATMLSAQSTDRRVNIVTTELFKTVKKPQDILDLGKEALVEVIRSIGFYNSKAEHILQTCRLLVQEYGGQVPGTMEALTSFPGVGRKTANVVLSNCFGVPAMAVDTHVFRVSHRLGFSSAKTPEQTEQDLTRLLPKERWTKTHNLFIFHGRRLCKAQRPLCLECPVRPYCLYYKNLEDDR